MAKRQEFTTGRLIKALKTGAVKIESVDGYHLVEESDQPGALVDGKHEPWPIVEDWLGYGTYHSGTCFAGYEIDANEAARHMEAYNIRRAERAKFRPNG